MNLIEQLNDLCTKYEDSYSSAYFMEEDLRAIIEQAKREAAEPVAVPVAWCWYNKNSGAFVLGNYEPEYDTFPDDAIDIEPLYTSPQPDHTKLIGELVSELSRAQEALEYYEDCTGIRHDNGVQFTIGGVLTKAREAIK